MHSGSVSTAVEGAPPEDRPAVAARIGQYEIIRPLGTGGMAEVHLARDLRLGRLVAVKLLMSQPDLDKRFLAEAQATARCHHENIVVIYEVGTHLDRPYMVLEYLEGQTLREWLNEQRSAEPPARVPPLRAVELMLPVVRALAYAHDQGIVHRDLKPENVMLTRAGTIKVLDFGIAAPVLDAAVPASGRGAAAGTLPYMSPEQLTRGAVDHRADVWAAGIMLFELVAGMHPLNAAAPDLRAMIADPATAIPAVAERAPALGSLAPIIDRCLIKDAEHRTPSAHALLAELEALARSRRTTRLDDSGPFAGLAAFQESDAERFFGRERDTELVVAELRGRPLVAIVGPSGTGKSSLVRAGVIPALKRSGEDWDACIVRPSHDPLAALGGALGQVDSVDPAVGDPTPAQLSAEPGTLGARLRALATSKHRRIALFVDQLEELYTLGVAPEQRAAFFACLGAIADDPASPLRVVVAIRSDFLDRLSEDRRIGAAVTRGLILLPPMDRDGMRQALVRPTEDSEHRFDPPALVDRMIDDLADTPGALPLLQFTAARLWEQRDRERRLLTAASYEQLGGVAGALASHADAVLAGMSSAQQALTRTVFERLVTPERTRDLASVAELHALRVDPSLVDDVVQRLTSLRLVVVERGPDGDAMVELAHDSLIERWPTLVRWLDENHGDAAMRARVRAAARDWEHSGRAAGLLWTGDVASQSSAWQQRYRGELAPVELDYLAAVHAVAERTRRGRRRAVIVALAATALVAIAMASLAWRQTALARRERLASDAATREAMRARDATRMAAMRTLPGDPTSQLALLREIEDLDDPPPGARQEAKRLLYSDLALAIWTSPEALYSVAYSPDGKRIASAHRDAVVRIWNADGSGAPLVLSGHREAVMGLAFSPDGQRIASASADKTVRVWNADGSGAPRVLSVPGPAYAIAFSPDGRRLAAGNGGEDAALRIWSGDGSDPVVLRGHAGPVVAVAFSPDGRHIASGSEDATLRIWDLGGSDPPVILRGHEGRVDAVAFSPDGRRVASGGHDKTVRMWSADGAGEPTVVRGHDEIVRAIAFSPDGQHLASASGDRTVRVWAIDGGGEPRVLRGHEAGVMAVAYSPDGQRIVSGGLDKMAWIWPAQHSSEPVILRHDKAVHAATFSPDGRRIATGCWDKKVRVWSADGSAPPRVLGSHDEAVTAVQFSPDGRRVLSASWDRTLRVWSADGTDEPVILRGHDGLIGTAMFSPDGRHIVSASDDKTIRVWNADGAGEAVVLRGHDEYVQAAAFSPDGRRVASASIDTTVRVWNADGSGQPLVLRGHTAAVQTAAFSPDGRHIASGSDDKTIRVWNADGSGEARVLSGHEDIVFWVEYSPDGRSIVSGSRDKTVRIWPADGSGEPVVLLGHDHLLRSAAFSPDGHSIVSASWDGTARVWHDLARFTLADPRLWTVTGYCMPADRRVKLLGAARAQAGRDQQSCERRIAAARP